MASSAAPPASSEASFDSAAIRPKINLSRPVTSYAPVDIYTGFTGPTSFGGGQGRSASSGDLVAINNITVVGRILLPSGYVSGSMLLDSATWDNQTFNTLGVTVGTYTWTWGSGAHADSFTLDIKAAPGSGRRDSRCWECCCLGRSFSGAVQNIVP
jgi:hypothetical protein